MEDKEKLLSNYGYIYNSSRMIYHNKAQNKIFSVEFIKDNSLGNIEKKMKEKSCDWTFYFSYPRDLEEKTKKEIILELENGK